MQTSISCLFYFLFSLSFLFLDFLFIGKRVTKFYENKNYLLYNSIQALLYTNILHVTVNASRIKLLVNILSKLILL